MQQTFTKIARLTTTLLALALSAFAAMPNDSPRQVRVRDITTIAGVRDNQLVGYGIVVGLSGTGDRSQTVFTTQTLANAMRRMGVQIDPTVIRVNNVAAVFVTASLPQFARPGMKLDVTVSSVGDAKSLEGGVLMLTSLLGPDGQVYAEAQGPLTLGGYSAGNAANAKIVNHTTVGSISEGAIVERGINVDLNQFRTVSLMLRDPDFSASRDIAAAINKDFDKPVATALDSRRVDVNVAQAGAESVPLLIARVQELSINVNPPAKVIINERTGTIVMGGDVKLSKVSVLHGNLSIDVTTKFEVSQPEGFSKGETKVVPDQKLEANDAPVRSIHLDEGASVEVLINGLHVIGASARDIVAILQAIKAAGGLHADLEVM